MEVGKSKQVGVATERCRIGARHDVVLARCKLRIIGDSLRNSFKSPPTFTVGGLSEEKSYVSKDADP